MYAGMYAQANQAAMYASITVGYARLDRPLPVVARRPPGPANARGGCPPRAPASPAPEES